MVFWGQYVFESIRRNIKETFNVNPYFQNIIMLIFYGGIGFILGLDHLIQEIKKQGEWVINIPKLVFMVIPSLYFSLAIFIYYVNIPFIRDVLSYPIGILLTGNANFISIFQLILGYSVITSFYKKNEELSQPLIWRP
jgi:Trk-type K+ transport system membrane component